MLCLRSHKSPKGRDIRPKITAKCAGPLGRQNAIWFRLEINPRDVSPHRFEGSYVLTIVFSSV